jgi:hypothetical protein
MKVVDILSEVRDRRDAYQRDYDNSVAGMGKRQSYAYSQDGGANDEGDDKIDARIRAEYEKKKEYEQSGKFWLKQKDTQEHISDSFVGKAAANAAALELLKQQPELKGNLVITAYGPDEKQESVTESATAGATSAGNVATLGMNPKLSPGPARGKKSYIGRPGQSGTKAPPQPKVIQPKTKHGTAVNALDMKSNIFGGGKAIKRK